MEVFLVPREGDCTFTELYSLEMPLPGKLMSCLCLQKQGWGLYGKIPICLCTVPHAHTEGNSLPRAQERHIPACPPGKQVSTR